ncbi:MAG TPA: hypothetical protein VGL05_30195 [Kribbella sp.]
MTSWLLMTAFAAFSMLAMRWTPDKIDVVLVRVAGFSFVGAGLIGASGWVGSFMNSTLGWLFRSIDDVTKGAFGTGAAWILAAGMTAMWIGAMLPDKWFSFDPPDWLVISGLIIPSLSAMVPGKAGNAFETVTAAGGHALNTWVAGLF